MQVKIVERARQLGEDPSKGAGTYDWGACGWCLEAQLTGSSLPLPLAV